MAREGLWELEMRTPRLWCFLFFILLTLSLHSARLCAQESEILAQFHPYSQGTPHLPALESGIVLTKENVQLVKEVLPDEIVQLLVSGDFSISSLSLMRIPPMRQTTDRSHCLCSLAGPRLTMCNSARRCSRQTRRQSTTSRFLLNVSIC